MTVLRHMPQDGRQRRWPFCGVGESLNSECCVWWSAPICWSMHSLVGTGQKAQPISEWGKGLYLLRCASCHGVNGKGDGPTAAVLTHPSAGLTTISKHHGGTFPSAEVMPVIDGAHPVPAHGPRHLPVWRKVCCTERSDSEARMQILALMRFLKSIQEP